MPDVTDDNTGENTEQRASRYQVIGECAHVTTVGLGGVSAMTLLYKGAFLPEGVDQARIRHLLDSKLIAEVGDAPIAPNAAVEQPNPDTEDNDGDGDAGDGVHPVVTDEQRQQQAKASADADAAERRRAEARAKLPADGSAPDGRASFETWVEYAVVQGMDRSEVEKASKEELRRALGGKS
jgi:hypothetical protein